MRIGSLSQVRRRARPGMLVASGGVSIASLEHIVILGASLETGAFGGGIDTQNTEVVYAQNRIQAATGKSVTIHQYAVSGQDLQGTVSTSLPKALSEQANLPGNGRTLVILGSGGNTISGSAKPTPGQTLINSKSQWLSAIAQIEAKGWDWVLFDLSWRNYDAPRTQYDRGYGSWLWNTQVVKSINASRNRFWGRQWTYADGTSWGDLYTLYRNNVQMLADEVHPSDYLVTRNYMIDSVMIPAITGVPLAQRLPRDEVYPLTYSVGTPAVTQRSIAVPSTASHQGVSHVALYAAGSTPTAAQVIAGNGTGFVAKVSAGRNGTTIDSAVSQTVVGAADSTPYVVASVFVSDAQQTSAVVTRTATTGVGTPVSTTPVVILMRQDSINGGRANTNVLTAANALTDAGTKIANAVDLSGVPSGIGYVQVTGFNQVNAAGQSAYSVPGFFVAGELNQSWYVDLGTANVNLTGFTPGRSYKLTFAANRDVPSTDLTRTGDLTITAGTVAGGVTTQTLNAANPPSGTTAASINFTITPTAGGVISFSFKRTPGNTGFGYLGGIHIQPL